MYSTPELILNRLSQGSVHDALLFFIYVNDITETIHESNIFIFADDSTLVTKNQEVDTLEIESYIKINDLGHILLQNCLKLNKEKNKSHENSNQLKEKYIESDSSDIWVSEEKLELTKSAELLGVTLGKWHFRSVRFKLIILFSALKIAMIA